MIIAENLAAMAAAASKRVARLDILVNNGAVRDVTPIDDIDLARWRQVMGTNLDGAFLCVKPAFRRARTGKARS